MIVAGEGAVGLVMALVLVVRAASGADQHVVNGYGTAAWFAIFGTAVLAAGLALVAGKRWGRGIAVMMQLLLLPVAWYAAVGSHRLALGVPIAIVAVAALVFLFSPTAQMWASGDEVDTDQSD
ncbi:hypothetical protein CCUG63695_03170 [Mycobacteroides franklinii]|uniref:Integral membrane protein n=2 Tax=Mycobacteroides franklinii TaxID=948102 RepID=A0A4R8R306_9MYCO|nr:hypothetical protein CCUG64054_03243 [Mycobacteroides franklinii]TDZ50324.1 hypothetical protein CCUG63697_01829 [Mycobacteroides franklinii]TDZ56744.1 hypothetical protein CCUG63696_03245 [Mycobacteroides franklinii]TDZ63685.1 hypothetical protein CCUG63695_03170 [Mycobacteroides franklinii]TDZ70082.1 hypothetical protein CCUG64056_03243 [Mycobacteroides franklinii]